MKQMKKRTALGPRVASFAMIAMLLAAGCAQPYGGAEPVVEPGPAPSGQPLSVLMEGPSTKMNVNDDTGYCTWATTAPKDRIAIWVSGSGANAYREAEVTVEDTNADARVGGVTLSVADAQTREHYAVFPASSAVAAHHTADDLCVVYPTSYDLSAVAASSLQTYAQPPMVAVNDASDPSLKFYHVGGLLRIELSSSEIVGATSVAVTFLGLTDVTGTYKVVDGSGTGSSRTESAPVSGTGNEVTFTIPAVGSTGQTWVNVPLPAGDYSKLKGVQVSVSGGGVNKTQVKAAPWPNIARRQGKKLSFNFAGAGALSYVDIAAEESVTLWKGVTTESFGVSAFDSEGTQLTGASFTWTSSDSQVASVDPATGKVTAVGPGSATIKASCTVGGVTKEDSFTVYVNEVTSITLSPSELAGRVGKSRKIKAEVTYTRNGNWSVPELSWHSTNTSIATVDMASTLPGEANTIVFNAIGTATVTASFDPSVYGTEAPSATCAVEVIYNAYVPGKFTVSAGKSVWFASGNVLYKADKSGDNWTNPRYEFAANQWDYYADASNYTDGTDRVIDHFGWATAGVKNQNGNYGYDEYHTNYSPYDIQSTFSTSPACNYYYYGPSTDGGMGSGWAQKGAPAVVPNGGDVYFPYGVVINNTWNSDLAGGLSTSNQVRKFCDWGLHFNNDGSENKQTPLSGTWYTLSVYEWNYLFETRDKAKLLRGLGMIYDTDRQEFVSGLIILPDNWEETPEDCTFLPIASDYGFNIYIAGSGTVGNYVLNGRWEEMEAAGAVFLPAAGYREGSDFSNNDRYGYYWSSSAYGIYGQFGHCLSFYSGYVRPQHYDRRYRGIPVRLVHD